MAIVMESVSYEPTQPAGYDFVAEFRYGSNGEIPGVSELDVGTDDDQTADSQTWDANLNDGLDSGLVDVELVVRTGGYTLMVWTIGGTSLTYLGPECTNIEELQIRSSVSTQAAMRWESMELTMSYESAQVDSWSRSIGPEIDLTDASDPSMEERMLTIAPESRSVDEIRLTAKVRMQAAAGVHLDANELFGQVLIKGHVV